MSCISFKTVCEDTRITANGSYQYDNVLRLMGAQNEKLFGQIVIFTSQQEQIKSISVKQFKNNDECANVDIQIYWEYCIRIKKPSCSYGGTGEYPEILVPIEAMLKTPDAKLAADDWCVIMVEAKLSKDVKSGIYFSAIEVVCEKETLTIPIELTVYGFSLPEQNHSRTSFAVFFENQAYANKDVSPCNELLVDYQKYYNLLKSFRISASELPVESAERPGFCASGYRFTSAYEPHRGISETDIPNFVETAKKYAKDPEIAAYILPYRSYVDEEGKNRIDIAFEKEILLALVNGSTNELDLLSKAYFYITFADEPTSEKFPCVRAVKEDCRQAMRMVADEANFTGKEKVRISLLTIDNVVTAWPDEKLYGGVDTWCPQYSGFSAPELLYEMKCLGELGSKFWWYGCMVPHYPYPSYHIDEPLLSARLEGILRYRFGIRGNLYWAVNMSVKFNNESKTYEKNDPYEEPMTWANANGDGLLLYDGERFGYDGPIPSMRLAAICEGNQDYEYCLLLEQAIKHLNKQYDIEIDPVHYLRPLWDKIHYRTMCFAGGYSFRLVRRELADSIMAAYRGLLVEVAGIDAEHHVAVVNVYFPSDCKVSCLCLNAERRKSGGGEMITMNIPLQENKNTYCDICFADKHGEFIYRRLISPPVKPIPLTLWNAENTVETTLKDHRLRIVTEKFIDGDFNPIIVARGDFDFENLDSFILNINSYSEKPFILSVSIFDKKGKEFVLGYDIFEKGQKTARVHYHPRLQLKPGFQDNCYTASTFYTEQERRRNAIDLHHITEIKIRVQNPRLVNEVNTKGVLPREFSVAPYEFDMSVYYTEWAGDSPHTNYD